jgi:NADH dehydrogenase
MHVAVLGAGYAGVGLTRQLERTLPEDVEITVVDERDTHLVQHLLHRVVRYPSLEEKLTIPLGDLLDRATHRQARVVDVDPESGAVDLADGSLSADFLAVCLGAQTAFYDLPGLEEHAVPLKRLSHAEQIRQEFDSVRGEDGKVVVGGAGLSGVQVAGELAEMTTSDGVDVLLLERLDSVAPSFPPQFQRAVAEELTDRGVRVETGRTVQRAEDDVVVLADGDEMAYDQLIWTGGIAGQDAVGGERPEVRATLRLGERAFAVGDTARVVDANGERAPASAQTAIRQATVAASNIGKLVDYERTDSGFEPRLDTYRFDELGWMVSIGDGTVAQVGPAVLRGAPADAIKTTVGAGYLGSIGAVENATDYVRKSVSPAD